jgi:hypothetical protein
MTTPFLSYPFAASSRPGKVALPDRLAKMINVKDDFGAKGDDFADDTIPLQNAFDAAFGPASSPNGNSGQFNNRPVFIPAGIYRVSQRLGIKWVQGGVIFGAGNPATTLKYVGGPGTDINPAGGTYTPIFRTNGAKFCTFKNFALSFSTQVKVAGTRCFQHTWQGGGVPNEIGTSACQLINIGASGAEYGISVGEFINPEDPGPIAGVTNPQSDTTEFVNPIIDNCLAGIYHGSFNAISNGLYGGRITNCSPYGIHSPAGCLQFVCGTYFSNGNAGSGDISQDTGDPSFIASCVSNTWRFIAHNGGAHLILGNRQISTYAGSDATFCFLNAGATATLIANYSLHGSLQGNGSTSAFYLLNNQFDGLNWTNPAGVIGDFVHPRPMFMSAAGNPAADVIPPSAWWAEGLTFNVHDSNTNTQFAGVSGGGTIPVLARYNGGSLRVIGK